MPNIVVIISEDKAACDVIDKTLGRLGYTVNELEERQFQSDYARLNPEYIFLDLKRQEGDGIELLHFLAKMDCRVPIILIGESDERVLSSAKRIGEDLRLNIIKTLRKPLDEKAVESAVNLIERSLISPTLSQLAKAIEGKEFVLFYQPKYEIKTKSIMGVEALLRWKRGEHQIIEPDKFIPLAEESGLIVPLTYWVIEESARQAQMWAETYNIRIQVAVNLSAKVLTNINLPDEILKISKNHHIDPGKFCFEITESAAMENPSLINEVLTRLRINGFVLSIDDFGTGYSSLVELQRLPFNEIKVDRSFIKKIVSSPSEHIITSSIIKLSRSLGLTSVAEGVEDEASNQLLEKLGCDVIQGFYLARPMPAEDFIEWLKQNADKDLHLKRIGS